jgi:predicted O-linked N-acetylglucosamine transferase (SPINDLY family)
MSIFNDFDTEFNTLIEDPNKIEKCNLYDRGIHCVLNTNDVLKKEEILSKLLFIYPNKIELYYYMGYILKDSNFYKSLMWYQICYQKDPSYIENLLDLTKSLFETNNVKSINHLLDSKWDIIKNIDDNRFILLLGTIYIAENKISKAYKIFIKLLEKIKNNENIGEFKYYVYLNSSYMYGLISDIYKSVFYLNKIFKDEAIITNSNIILQAYHSYMLKCDYLYIDNKQRFQSAKKINTFYKIENNYKWKMNKDKKKIRIGYFSNSLFDHAVSNFILPILHNYDSSRFEIVLFTEQVNKTAKYNSELTDIGIKIIHVIKNTAQECADIIYGEQIDILIDLDGYTKDNRLDVFSKNPAPIQMTYLGYPNSLGLDFIKYRIVDRITDPPDSTQLYSEKRLYLPKCFLIFKPICQISPFEPKFLKKDDTIILGSLNKQAKNSIETIEAWKTILKSTKNTVLLIKTDGIDGIDDANERTLFYKEKLDVPEDRFIVKNFCSNEREYIELLQNIDILLDTFPYSGTTTTCNALYNSTPVITYYNKNYHSHNVSSSILKNCGHEELITYNVEDYIKKVIELSSDYEKINMYKRTLGKDFANLMNAKEFIKEYEKIMINVYKENCS